MSNNLIKISLFDIPNEINGNTFSDDFTKILDKHGNVLYEGLCIPRSVLNRAKKDIFQKRDQESRKTEGKLKGFLNMVKRAFRLIS